MFPVCEKKSHNINHISTLQSPPFCRRIIWSDHLFVPPQSCLLVQVFSPRSHFDSHLLFPSGRFHSRSSDGIGHHVRLTAFQLSPLLTGHSTAFSFLVRYWALTTTTPRSTPKTLCCLIKSFFKDLQVSVHLYARHVRSVSYRSGLLCDGSFRIMNNLLCPAYLWKITNSLTASFIVVGGKENGH